MNPEGKVRVVRGVEISVMEGDGLVSTSGRDADGFGAAVYRNDVGKIARGVTPVIEIIGEAVSVDDQGVLGLGRESHTDQ